MQTIEIVQADLENVDHQRDVVMLIDAYARDPMGNGSPLPIEIQQKLVPGLRNHPTSLVLLAYFVGDPVGIAVCFTGFSTFMAKPLINIHDLAVLDGYRGHGVGKLLLEAVEEQARARGCCKVTLEVLENNQRAKGLYESVGFGCVQYQQAAGSALFMAKSL